MTKLLDENDRHLAGLPPAEVVPYVPKNGANHKANGANEHERVTNNPAAAPEKAHAPRPMLARRVYTLADLEADRNQDLVPLAALPERHGWGADLDRQLGGGLGPGDVLAIGAGSAGAGKTALVMQLADGLALRSAAIAADTICGPLTPTVLLSEMDPRALARRTLARLCGVPARIFRSGKAAERCREDVAGAYALAARHLEPGGAFARMTTWQRTARPVVRGGGMLELLEHEVQALRDELARVHPGREIWPVVVIDPLQRWQDPERSEVEALNELSEELDQLADTHGWIVLLTSDTNKTTAAAVSGKGTNGSRDRNADRSGASPDTFRGSYKLQHACDAVLAMTAAEAYDPASRTRDVFIEVLKNRNGPSNLPQEKCARLRWHPASGWFEDFSSGNAPPSRRVVAC